MQGVVVRLKKGLVPDEQRRKREANIQQIRKDKKDNSIQKRRRDWSTSLSSGQQGEEQIGTLPDPNLKAKLDTLPTDMQLLHSSEPAEQIEATIRFRKLLSVERNPPIAEVIAAGAVPRLVQFCQCCTRSTVSERNQLCHPPLALSPAPACTHACDILFRL